MPRCPAHIPSWPMESKAGRHPGMETLLASVCSYPRWQWELRDEAGDYSHCRPVFTARVCLLTVGTQSKYKTLFSD